MLKLEGYNLSRTEWEHLIDEYIFSERDRAIVKRRLLDGVRFEPLAEEFELSVQHTHTIVDNAKNKLSRALSAMQKNSNF